MNIDTKHWTKHPTKSGWFFKSKNGNSVRIVCTDRDGKFPLLDDEGLSYTETGRYHSSDEPSPRDLIFPPPWELGRSVNGFPLGDGQDWHRNDWTAEMLPYGWRPLIKDEIQQEGDEWKGAHDWVKTCEVGSTIRSSGYYRTRRPLPPTIDPYAELKAAYNAGKTIEYNCGGLNEDWHEAVGPNWKEPVSRYRIKPAPKLVPLTPDDVNIGDEIQRRPSSKFRSGILSISPDGVQLYSLFVTWKMLQDQYQINRKDGNGWRPCEKQENE